MNGFVTMEPNDDDISFLNRLAEVAPIYSRSWLDFGDVARDDLDEDLIADLLELAPLMKFQTGGEGRQSMPAVEWLGVYHTARSEVFQRMRRRSFELAVARPSENDLAHAPLFTSWLPVRGPAGIHVALVGRMSGHPMMSDGWIVTSFLCGLDEQGAWARSTSRWCRLVERTTPSVFRTFAGPQANGISGASLPMAETLTTLAQEQEDEVGSGSM
ncbi:MAG: DUF6634 family protein [Paracoccaceae bacterium]